MPAREYDYTRYLTAKRTVDDRALNRAVIERLRSELTSGGTSALSILELGAGVGTMLPRLVEWGLVERARYTLVDVHTPSLRAARAYLERWNPQVAFLDDDSIHDGKREAPLTVEFAAQDIFAFLEGSQRSYDLILANAVLDLLDVPRLLRLLCRGERTRLLWFTINFDGETIFLPELALDGPVFSLYHRSMDERPRDGGRAGDSRSGRHLLQQLLDAGASLLGAGSSDWVVVPGEGGYNADEAYFLNCIVETIAQELWAHPELDSKEFESWIEQRRSQIEQRKLMYIAHQIDVLARSPAMPRRGVESPS